MTQPLEAPSISPGRPRRPWPLLVAGVAVIAALAVVGLGAYQIGKRFNPAPPWDPVWLRAYLDRPLDHTAPGTGFWVAGYYVDYDANSFEVVKTRSTHMDQVVVFGFGFDAQGNLTGKDEELVKGLVERSKRVFLFANVTDAGFSQELAHAILTDQAVQDRAVKSIVDKVKELDGGGVQIDFENIAPTDRAAFTAFLKRLKGELQPLQVSLSIAASAKTSDVKDGWGGAEDYAAIGQIVDQVYIMAYDEHWRGGEPGPVASLSWTEQVIRYATGVMPAQKIVLGVPFYGYEWAVDSKQSKTNRAYGFTAMAQRLEQMGATPKWDPVAGENFATYKADGSDRIAWWPDQRSLDAKMKLAYQYNLKGVALWRLGFEDDAWWNAMGAFRVSPNK